MGVFGLTGQKYRPMKSERISMHIPSEVFFNFGRLGDVGQYLGRGNRCV